MEANTKLYPDKGMRTLRENILKGMQRTLEQEAETIDVDNILQVVHLQRHLISVEMELDLLRHIEKFEKHIALMESFRKGEPNGEL